MAEVRPETVKNGTPKYVHTVLVSRVLQAYARMVRDCGSSRDCQNGDTHVRNGLDRYHVYSRVVPFYPDKLTRRRKQISSQKGEDGGTHHATTANNINATPHLCAVMAMTSPGWRDSRILNRSASVLISWLSMATMMSPS